jgi:hypothetical protein
MKAVSCIAREDAHLIDGVELFSIPIQSERGMRRVGVDVPRRLGARRGGDLAPRGDAVSRPIRHALFP